MRNLCKKNQWFIQDRLRRRIGGMVESSLGLATPLRFEIHAEKPRTAKINKVMSLPGLIVWTCWRGHVPGNKSGIFVQERQEGSRNKSAESFLGVSYAPQIHEMPKSRESERKNHLPVWLIRCGETGMDGNATPIGRWVKRGRWRMIPCGVDGMPVRITRLKEFCWGKYQYGIHR